MGVDMGVVFIHDLLEFSRDRYICNLHGYDLNGEGWKVLQFMSLKRHRPLDTKT
jgi:hypothetical protein